MWNNSSPLYKTSDIQSSATQFYVVNSWLGKLSIFMEFFAVALYSNAFYSCTHLGYTDTSIEAWWQKNSLALWERHCGWIMNNQSDSCWQRVHMYVVKLSHHQFQIQSFKNVRAQALVT